MFLLFLLVSACATASPQLSYYDAGDEEFVAVEPTTLGLIASPTIWQVLEPIASGIPESSEGNQDLAVYVGRTVSGYSADVITSNMLDDSVMARHVRLYLRKEPEGWFIINTLVRYQCYRSDTHEWQTAPCP